MIYKDNLVSAFCRLLYHFGFPVAYAFVLITDLVIPVGTAFGSRYPPSLSLLPSDLRSFASQFFHCLPLSGPTTLMIYQVSFPNAIPPSRDVNPDHKDPMN